MGFEFEMMSDEREGMKRPEDGALIYVSPSLEQGLSWWISVNKKKNVSRYKFQFYFCNPFSYWINYYVRHAFLVICGQK